MNFTSAVPLNPPPPHIASPMCANEVRRLETLIAFDILDTERDDPVFDRITSLVADFMKADIALVSLVDKDRQWFKSAVGLEAAETGRDVSFCSWGILPEADPEPIPFVVEDATRDIRFAGSPLVVGAPEIRFYYGVPLVAANSERIGTLCAISKKPREGVTPQQQQAMQIFAAMVMQEIELRKPLAGSLAAPVGGEKQSLVLRKTVQKTSHDLRTPLHAITGSAELLAKVQRERGASPEEMELTATVMKAAQELTAVIDKLVEGHGVLRGSFVIHRTSTSSPLLSRRALAGQYMATQRPTSLDGCFALNVDDSMLNRSLMARFLKKLGVSQVVDRENGREAVDYIDQALPGDPSHSMPTVIFMDLQMPVMGGTTAADLIRKSCRGRPDCPYLVAVTADATDGVWDRCESAGFDELLIKPFLLPAIQDILGRVLAKPP